MSLHDFWINVRSALRTTGPGVSGGSQFDAAGIEAVLRKSPDWLTIDTIDGFDEADFAFLPDADRSRLKGLVETFRVHASTRKFRRPPTPETVEDAVPILREVIQILEFDRYESPDAFRLGKRVERAVQDDAPPPELVGFRFREGLDHSGSPGLWIRVILSDEIADSDDRFLEAAREIRPWIDRIARRAAPEHWPYITFRSAAEEAELVEAS